MGSSLVKCRLKTGEAVEMRGDLTWRGRVALSELRTLRSATLEALERVSSEEPDRLHAIAKLVMLRYKGEVLSSPESDPDHLEGQVY